MPKAAAIAPAAARRLQEALAAEDWPQAERLLRGLAAKKGAPASVLYNLGLVLDRAGKGDQSGPWFRRAVTADPGHVNAWCELGSWLLARNDLPGAEQAFSRAAALGDPTARRDHARVALRLGHFQVARAGWQAILDASAGTDTEALHALLRIALEEGAPIARDLRRSLAAQPGERPALLKTLTRTARGSLPLSPKDL